MLFKQILLASALQVALTSAIDNDVNASPFTRRYSSQDLPLDVGVDRPNDRPTTVSGNIRVRGDNVKIDVQASPGSHTDNFLNNHPKGNRLHDDSDSDSDDEDNVNVDINHHDGTTTVGGNVQTRSANVDVNVNAKEGSHTDRFLDKHPKGNRIHDDSDSDDEDNVNIDVNHQEGATSVNGNVQARNVNVNVNTTEGSHTDRFLDNHPKGNRIHDYDSDSDDEDNVNVNVDHKDGKTSVGGSVQTRNIDIDVDTEDGSHTGRFLNNHPKGNRVHDDSDSEDEDNFDVNADHQDGKTTIGGSIQSRNVDVNVDTKEGSHTDRFLDNHPKGNRFHDDSEDEDEDNVNINVDHKDGATNVGGTIQTRGYTHVNNFDGGFTFRTRGDNSVNVDVTPKPNSRVGKWLKDHPSGNRVHEDEVNVDVDHKYQDGKTTVNGNIQTRDNGNAIVVNRCEHDIWVWSVDEGGSSDAIKVGGRSRHTEPFRTPTAGGVVYKVSNSDQLINGEHTQFEYAISNGQIYYDLSFVNCAEGESADKCPGHKNGLLMYSNEESCGKVDCAPGSYCPKQAYYVDTPLSKLGIEEPVYGCGSAGTGHDLYMVVCSDKPNVFQRSIAGRLSVEF